MKLGVRRTAFLSVVTMVICFFGVVLAFGQAAPQRPAQPPPAQSQAAEQKAEDVKLYGATSESRSARTADLTGL